MNSGKVFRDVEVLDSSPTWIRIRHSTGIHEIPVIDFDSPTRRKLLKQQSLDEIIRDGLKKRPKVPLGSTECSIVILASTISLLDQVAMPLQLSASMDLDGSRGTKPESESASSNDKKLGDAFVKITEQSRKLLELEAEFAKLEREPAPTALSLSGSRLIHAYSEMGDTLRQFEPLAKPSSYPNDLVGLLFYMDQLEGAIDCLTNRLIVPRLERLRERQK